MVTQQVCGFIKTKAQSVTTDTMGGLLCITCILVCCLYPELLHGKASGKPTYVCLLSVFVSVLMGQLV